MFGRVRSGSGTSAASAQIKKYCRWIICEIYIIGTIFVILDKYFASIKYLNFT